jgi:type I restriction enzyme S subunit
MKITKHKLGKLCDIRIGRTPARAKASYWGEGNPWLSIADMKEKYVTRTKEEITDRAVKECNCTIVPQGTLLMSFKLSIGKMAIAGRDMFTNEAIAAFVPKNKDLDVEYLYYALKHYSFGSLNVAAKGTTLNKASLALLSVPVPESIDDQRRIAALLSRAEGLIAQRKESIRLLDELVRSVFLEMFGDPVRNEKGWVLEPIGSIADVRRGSSPRPIDKFMGGTVPWIKIGDGTKGDEMFITETAEFVTEVGAAKSVYLEPGSLIVSNSGVSLGFARILGIAGCVHDGWLSLSKLDEMKINKVFLLKLINMLTPVFRRRAPDGGQPNLNIAIFRTYPIPTPPLELQQRFASAVDAANSLSKTHRASLEGLEQLYGSLSQRAFRGELTEVSVSHAVL